jgi:hypothetical protein
MMPMTPPADTDILSLAFLTQKCLKTSKTEFEFAEGCFCHNGAKTFDCLGANFFFCVFVAGAWTLFVNETWDRFNCTQMPCSL